MWSQEIIVWKKAVEVPGNYCVEKPGTSKKKKVKDAWGVCVAATSSEEEEPREAGNVESGPAVDEPADEPADERGG